jgi:deoxycytidylate deaminase
MLQCNVSMYKICYMKSHNWNTTTQSTKQKINKSKPIFIIATRDLSQKRIIELTNVLGSKKQLLWGCAKEKFIEGLEDSIQFKTLSINKLETTLESLKSNLDVKILNYHQRDLKYILKELDFSAVIFINGSWYKMIHLKEEFWTIVNKKIPYKFLSPFTSEQDAKDYVNEIQSNYGKEKVYESKKKYTDEQLLKISEDIAKQSFDWVYQTGAVLAKNGKIIASAYNSVVPYESYSMHFGSVREKNYSPPNDQNHYDTNHAEVELFLRCVKEKIDMNDSTLYINLLPCPTCARMISKSEIREIVYQHDHSEGYAYKLLTKAGKFVRRVLI